jgi:phosphatidylglycerol:prolipoprotein diacylglycerol transferase
MFANWINPVALQIGPLAIHWYGLMYLITFVTGYLLLKYSRQGRSLPLTDLQKDNLVISILLGVILGGRIGYILFYNLPFYFQHPDKILALWEGGLSFHGGLIGVVISLALYIYFSNKAAHKSAAAPLKKTHFLPIGDFVALVTPIGLTFVRLGNFINAELYGRVSPNHNLCLNFPTDPENCRYPSQLFEAVGEGLLLFTILYALSRKTKILQKPGRLSAAFLIIYGVIRTFLEYFREPDPQIGYLIGGPGFLAGLSLGQLLSLLMILAGLLMFSLLRRPPKKTRAK